jgi:hypothetical protein
MWAMQKRTSRGWDTRIIGQDKLSIESTTRWYKDNYPAEQWRSVKVSRAARRRASNGRSYAVKGSIPPRGWVPKTGDVVYIEGARTKLGRQDADGLFKLSPPVRGTVSMSARNIVQVARVANPSIRASKKRWMKELHKHWPHLSKAAELKERAALSRILKGAGKTPRALRSRANPNRSRVYGVTVPPSARDRGYYFTIRAKTAGAALAEARRYCARNAGMTTAGYKLPRGSSAKAIR